MRLMSGWKQGFTGGIFLAAFVAAFAPAAAHADGDWRPHRWLVQAQTWGTADAFKQDKDDLERSANVLVNDIGYDSAEFSSKIRGGLELRGGLMFLRPEGWEFGPSLGFIVGPRMNENLSAQSTVVGAGSTSVHLKTSFIRLMAQGAKEVPVSSFTRFRMGVGLGLAQGRMRGTGHSDGSFVTFEGFPPDESATHSWTGLTWEVTPSFIFGQVEIGVSYASFPKMKETDDFDAFKWNPFGLVLGVHF